MKKIYKIYILLFVFIILNFLIYNQNVQANKNENLEAENISNEVQIIYKNEKIKILNDNNFNDLIINI